MPANKQNPFAIGSDPELFIQNSKTGRFVSAYGRRGPMFPGTKAEPHKVECGAIQVDGVAAELNITPAYSSEEFEHNLFTVMQQLSKMVANVNPDYRLKAVPTAHFMPKYFASLPDEAKELGCDPDYSCYTGKENPRPQTDKPFRTGAGHIHIGWRKDNISPTDEGHMRDCILVTKQLDKYLLFASTDWDKDEERRKLYGAAGSFRPKPYGMEYRPLSNAFLPVGIHHAYSITQAVMKAIDSGTLDLELDISKQYGETNVEKVYNSLGGYIYDLQ